MLADRNKSDLPVINLAPVPADRNFSDLWNMILIFLSLSAFRSGLSVFQFAQHKASERYVQP